MVVLFLRFNCYFSLGFGTSASSNLTIIVLVTDDDDDDDDDDDNNDDDADVPPAGFKFLPRLLSDSAQNYLDQKVPIHRQVANYIVLPGVHKPFSSQIDGCLLHLMNE